MSEWKEYKLSEIAEITTGFPFKGNKYSSKGIRVVRGENVTIGDLRWDTIKCWNEHFDQFDKYSLKSGDIVIGMDGSRVGKNRAQIRSTDLPLLLAQRVACVRAKNGFSQDLIAYLIKSSRFERYVEMVHTGTSIPHISQKQIEEFNIFLPDALSTQTAIAEILSSLDDKIELNNKINQELETLAQTLFKQWFIDFEFPNENGEPYKSSGGEMVESELGEIPNGWEVGSIYDISSVIYGAPFKSSLFNQERKGYPLIRIRDLKTFKPQNWTEEVLSKGTKIQPGDLVVGMDAEFRPHFWLGEEGWLNQRVCLFKPKSEFSRLFVREIIRPLLAFYENSSVGTTVIHLGKGDIDTFKSIIPSNHLSKLFTELSEPLINKIIENSRENESLRNLRDTLLPKLISGELEINEIKN